MNFKVWLLAATFAVLSGCGGNSFDQDPGPLGEGNIPIGRVGGRQRLPARVYACDSRGRKFSTFTTADGVFEFPRFMEGLVVFEITPFDPRYLSDTVEVLMGPSQERVVNSRPVSKQAFSNITSVTLAIKDGMHIRLGDSVDLAPMVGSISQETTLPTIIVQGGIGKLDRNDRFFATAAGRGAIQVKIMGFEQSYTIFVDP